MEQGDGDVDSVLRFWWMLELFSPQKLPTLEGTTPRYKVRRWRRGQPLPWEDLPAAQGGNVWQHFVYLGVYELADVYETLRHVFQDDPDADDPRPPGRSACAQLVVDQDGRLMTDGTVLSSSAWALGSAHDPGPSSPRWMLGFEEDDKRLRERLQEMERLRQDRDEAEQPLPVDEKHLLRLLDTAQSVTGVHHLSRGGDGVLIRSKQVSPRVAAELTEADFFNSFFLKDLGAVRSAAEGDGLGGALGAYLTPDGQVRTDRRIDVRAQPQVVDAGTTAALLPPGRWPKRLEENLALSQQLAVNQALHGLTDTTRLMGVNGPPGTGKTTLLRDLIAGNLVERARRISELTRPQDAFTGEQHQWKSGDYPRTVGQLRPELCGFEMVVASANNSAVENVSVEIPAADQVKGLWEGRIDHFTDLASAILRRAQGLEDDEPSDAAGEQAPDEPEADAAWGLIAVPLGNKANRKQVTGTLWFAKGDENGRGQGLDRLLKQWASEPARPWAACRQDFADALAVVRRLQDERIAADERRAQVAEVRRRLVEIPAELADAVQQQAYHRGQLTAHLPEERRTADEHESLVEAVRRHLAAKPGVWEEIFTFGRAQARWRRQFDELNDRVTAAELTRRRCVDHGDGLRAAAHGADQRVAGLRAEDERATVALRALESACARDADRYGSVYPGREGAGDERELCAPWQDPELNAARSHLFVAALSLHRDLIRHLARDLRHWLRAAIEVVRGTVPPTLTEEKRLAAWQLFFLVVPVASSAFASIPRMFDGIGAEKLGWLFIDEAGQCAPQQAVGAIWRSQRVVAVGDPLQLEPIVPIPPRALWSIAHTYGVSRTWAPPRASVQTLADRVAQLGTWLSSRDEPEWVSSPLRVHRRCDEPMFGISNRIAYDGMMVSAVLRKPEPDMYLRKEWPDDGRLEASCWIDVPADNPGTSLQPAQISRARSKIEELRRLGVPHSDIFAISPFRPMADALEVLGHSYDGLRAGTIHTAQGREAPVVILVLGSAANKPGSRQWAASLPNLLNVAVSRAQRRLYVVGSLDDWKDFAYFDVLARATTGVARFD